MKLVTFFFVCFSVLAQTKPPDAAPAGKSAFDKAALDAYLRHVELWIPQVTVKIDDPKKSSELPGYSEVLVHLSYNGGVKDERYFVSQDGRKIIKGDVYDINQNPFQPNLDKLKTDMQPSFGAAGAPVVLVVFSDFQCPLCKEEAQILRKNITATFPDKVRVYFKDYPLDAIHNWARTAAIACRCIFRQNPDAFWDFHDWAYDNQSLIGLDNINSKIQDFAKQKGLDEMQFGRCLESKATEADVNRSIAEGRSLGIDATPTVFLNGRRLVGSTQWQVLEQLIRIEIDHQAKIAEAAEKCCEVTIPRVK